MAGALGIELAGPAYYFGEYYEKPTIGDPVRPIEPADIRQADDLMVFGSVMGLLLLGGLRFFVFAFIL